MATQPLSVSCRERFRPGLRQHPLKGAWAQLLPEKRRLRYRVRRREGACKAIAALAALASLIGPSVRDAEATSLWNAMDEGAATTAGGRTSTPSPHVLIYAEDGPCAETPRAATPDQKVAGGRPGVRRTRSFRKSHVYKAAVVAPRPMAVVHPPASHKAIHRHQDLRRHAYRRPGLARVAAISAPTRCVVLRSAILDSADLAFAGASDLPVPPAIPDTTPDFGIGGGLSGDGGFACGCGGGYEGGGEAFPNPVSGGGGGSGGSRPPVKPPRGPISAAPEPRTWMLTLLGVGLCGAALGRSRRRARAAV